MGIINVTPDSFSDGGHFYLADKAIAQAEKLIEDGADILDIGGESTRPYAMPVSPEDELSRTIPIISAIRRKHPDIAISIDTTKADVARAALDSGADIINDISALTKDTQMIKLAVERRCPVIIMHMQGTPADMQDRPHYDDVVEEICAFFKARLACLVNEGIGIENITIDPGIGFGKSLEHNIRIIKNLDRFSDLGCPVLLGHSRKSFLGLLTGCKAGERDIATAVISALSVQQKVDIVRVHDVAATRQALLVAEALR